MKTPMVGNQGLRLVAMLAMLVVIMAGIKAASPIVVPFLLAIFLAIVLNPLVKLLEKIRIPRTLAIVLLVTLIILLMALLFGRLGSSLNEFARSLPQYRGMMLEKMRDLQEFAMRFNIEFSVDDIMMLISSYFNLIILNIFYVSVRNFLLKCNTQSNTQ